MILRVEIVRLDPETFASAPAGTHIVLVTRTGGRAESLGPFASLWEACSVAGDLDDAEPIDAAALRPTRRRGDTEPLTFDAAAAARQRLDALARAAAKSG